MITLPITLVTTAVLSLMLIWLSFRVIGLRVSANALIGDEGNAALQYRIRSHANFTEYTPLFLILLGLIEFSQGNRITLLALAAVFVVSRGLHVVGMAPDANLKARQAGMVGTFLSLGIASLYAVFIALA